MRRGGDSRAPMLTIECVGPQEFWGPPRAALITPRRGRVGPRPGGASRSHGACALHRVDANAVRGGDHPHARAILPAQIGRCCGQFGRSRSAPMSKLPVELWWPVPLSQAQCSAVAADPRAMIAINSSSLISCIDRGDTVVLSA